MENALPEIINYLLDQETFPNVDIFNCRDTFCGDTPLHIAARTGQHELAQKLFAMRPEKCLQPNFMGQSPLFVAVQAQDM